eukprot:CAMPEP_0171465932 /NCGR_PEP_ID=MMETSP0945-20130129/8872_1 /TAXON_ID=109269 /ORGANISM="Vaucheria litorea, Strain CCMP2940" /LENGTH=399 /DNA_ID=CAMNT_0011993757 /DNA_START=22 /DNA_END=1221 /DNA_ORIENTATION=-
MSLDRVVSLFDYGAGNVRSVRNAIKKLGYKVVDIRTPSDIDAADVIIFPGVGNYGRAVEILESGGFMAPLLKYLQSNRPFFGICLGMQILFEGSEESPSQKGLGLIKGRVTKFNSKMVTVPHIGWNGIVLHKDTTIANAIKAANDAVYFVHSYRALPSEENQEWILGCTTHGEPNNPNFISAVQKGNVVGCQFHPEKSDKIGLNILKAFLENINRKEETQMILKLTGSERTMLRKRIVACLDVRTNDNGDLVVTKGDQYDVREPSSIAGQSKGNVRNLGKPVDLSERYFQEGADEITFLNITSFRTETLSDTPMLQVLEKASEKIFLPLTVGGGIRPYTDNSGKSYSALEVASEYFRAGADKISLGSDAVYAAEEYLKSGTLTGKSSIEEISSVYVKRS